MHEWDQLQGTIPEGWRLRIFVDLDLVADVFPPYRHITSVWVEVRDGHNELELVESEGFPAGDEPLPTLPQLVEWATGRLAAHIDRYGAVMRLPI